MIIKFQGQTVEKSIPIPLIGARIHCDPNYYFHYVRNLCQQLKSEANFIDLDFNLRTKRTFDLNYISTLKAENFCTHPPKQSWLGVFTYE